MDGYKWDTLWPPRSPYLTPLNFFFVGYLIDIVYATPPALLNDLIQCIQNIHMSIPRRYECCINNDGKQIEHILKHREINEIKEFKCQYFQKNDL